MFDRGKGVAGTASLPNRPIAITCCQDESLNLVVGKMRGGRGGSLLDSTSFHRASMLGRQGRSGLQLLPSRAGDSHACIQNAARMTGPERLGTDYEIWKYYCI